MVTTDYQALVLALRTRLDLTQEEFAARLGVSFATVNRWEGGRTTPQHIARTVLDDLARQFKVRDAGVADVAKTASTALKLRRRRTRRTVITDRQRILLLRLFDELERYRDGKPRRSELLGVYGVIRHELRPQLGGGNP